MCSLRRRGKIMTSETRPERMERTETELQVQLGAAGPRAASHRARRRAQRIQLVAPTPDAAARSPSMAASSSPIAPAPEGRGDGAFGGGHREVIKLRKRWLVVPALVLVALAFMALPTGTARADNGPHRAGWGVATDGCASCHRVHRGLNESLLRYEVETLCMSCHGDDVLGSVLNVKSGTNESTRRALRGGGFVRARINTADPSLPIPRFPAGSGTSANDTGVSVCYQDGIDQDADTVADDGCRPLIGVLAAPGALTQSSHSVDGSLQTIWGNGEIDPVANPGLADYDLECGKCHDPHGTGTYRILREVPSGSGGGGYVIPDTYPRDEDAPGHYDRTNYFDMTFTGNEATDNILKDTSAWCAQCHTRYLAARRAALPADASREDSGDGIFAFRHTSAGWGNSSATPPVASNNNRACITCHAAHGSPATAGEFSGPVPDPGAAEGSGIGAANSKLLKMNNRGMCQKCHNK